MFVYTVKYVFYSMKEMMIFFVHILNKFNVYKCYNVTVKFYKWNGISKFPEKLLFIVRVSEQ